MYRKTVRLLFTIRVVVEWQVLLDEKNIMKSVQMGEDTLFPKIRATDPTAIAAGTSCRHQILTEPIEALHPVSILRSCLKK
jgi:DNA-directed RNA polymerase subunit H (RpoH/RPB5)